MNLLLSEPEKEQEWLAVLEAKGKEPELYLVCIPFDRSYAAEIMTAGEYYKQEPSRLVIGIADHHQAALSLFQSMIDDVLKEDPSLEDLKGKLKERFL